MCSSIFSIRILDQQSISPKQETWWGVPVLLPSPDISWTRPSLHPVSSSTWWLMRVWYSERNTFVRKNVVGWNAACSIRSALALYFSLNQDLSFSRGVSSLLDNITTTPMSLATRQKTTPAKKSLTPLSDIRAAWTPHLDKKKYVWTIQFTFPVGRSSGAFQSDPEKDNLVVGPGFHLVVNIFSDRTTCPRSMRLQQ